MPYKTPTERLQQELEETTNHIEAGEQGIKASYTDRYDQPEEYPEPEKQPEFRFMESGALLMTSPGNRLIWKIQRTMPK